MRRRLVVLGSCLILTARLCNAQSPAARAAQGGDATLYSHVIRAEMKAAGLGENDAICLALPHYSNPSKALLKELKSDGLSVKKPDKCLFRGYEIRVEPSTADSIRVQLVDIRYVDTDLAVILSDGVYVIETETTGERKIRDYKALPPFDKN